MACCHGGVAWIVECACTVLVLARRRLATCVSCAAAPAGKLPFVIPADCPEALASLLHRCLHTDPMQRPTFDVVLAEVQAMLRGVPRAMGAGAPPQPTSVSVRGPSSPAGPQPAPKHESPFAQAAVTRAGSGPLITMSEPHA